MYVLLNAGQSGGPLFNETGQIIGISVSNSKDNSYDSIYPHINMAVPIADIFPALKKFATSKGKVLFNIVELNFHLIGLS